MTPTWVLSLPRFPRMVVVTVREASMVKAGIKMIILNQTCDWPCLVPSEPSVHARLQRKWSLILSTTRSMVPEMENSIPENAGIQEFVEKSA